MSDARLFSIPASAPFLPTLARALLDGELVEGFAPRGDPLALAKATVFLPTRRAARAFGNAILDALGNEAAILPRVVPLGDVDEDAFAFAESALGEGVLPAIAPTARRIVLAQLVLKFARVLPQATGDDEPLLVATPAAALLLADEVARLFDDMTIARVPFDALEGLVPRELDAYWQASLQFLKVARAEWLKYLAGCGLADPAERRDQLLAREAERLAAGEGGPVIAAGSTGSLPAVANLISVIARRHDGAVVLPGLDQDLDETAFALIEGGILGGVEIDSSPGHYQYGLKRLLKRLCIERDAVRVLGMPAQPRERYLSEAFRPAATSDRWLGRQDQATGEAAAALSGIAVVEAADPREEAMTIAIALREALERKQTAALVTPDRALARRVAAELTRWNIAVDDSAGIALADTGPGRFAQLVVTAAAEELAPIPLLALLRHPLIGLGAPSEAVDALELALLRGPRPAAGADGLARAIIEGRNTEFHRRDRRARLRAQDWDAALDLAGCAAKALAPLLQLADKEQIPFAILLAAHRAALAAAGLDLAIAEDDERRALAAAFEALESAAADAFSLDLAGYANAFGNLLSDQAPVRPLFDGRARIRILGRLEARLLDVERMVLGGLNEGIWPPETHADAWLNRPMRKELGLDLPERRVGLAAHDFAQAMGAPEVVLTRARKQNGVETVASRFLQRLAAIAPEQAWKEACGRGEDYRSLARALERPQPAPPIERPAPRPPVAARPTRLSVTDIETLIRDPYSIYARYVLGLEPLEEVDADPGAAERGTILHEALAKFVQAHPESLPADALDRLVALGRESFARVRDFPGVIAVWWPRFERIARWFVAEERERRKKIARILAEARGKIELDIGGSTFTLSAQADRIEVLKDGSVAVVDYKSGEAPTLPQALTGLAPQLPLEAVIARSGGFEHVKADARIDEIAVIRLSGGNPAGELRVLDPAKTTGNASELAKRLAVRTADDLAAVAKKKLVALLSAFADEGAPYHSIPRPKWRGRFGRYDHLARIKEWSADTGAVE